MDVPPLVTPAVQVTKIEVLLAMERATLVGALGTAFGVPFTVVEATDKPYELAAFI